MTFLEQGVSFFNRWSFTCGLFIAVLGMCAPLVAQQPLDADGYVQVVLCAHPAASQASGLLAAVEAEHKAARRFPDPVFEYSRANAHPVEGAGSSGVETGYALSQTIPWPGTFNAGFDVADRAADGMRAGADIVRWELEVAARETFARFETARSFLDIARAAETDARSLRDLLTRRADLGESRETDRIKTTVEWLRQQRDLVAAERETESAEANVRALAVEPLPRPLELKATSRSPLPPLDREAIVGLLLDRNPELRAALTEQNALNRSPQTLRG